MTRGAGVNALPVLIWRQMNLTIKNLPARVHRKLKQRARANQRSLNEEVIEILGSALDSAPPDTPNLLDVIRQLRSTIKGGWLTDEFLREAKNEGRP